jgi:hypothetical protein
MPLDMTLMIGRNPLRRKDIPATLRKPPEGTIKWFACYPPGSSTGSALMSTLSWRCRGGRDSRFDAAHISSKGSSSWEGIPVNWPY